MRSGTTPDHSPNQGHLRNCPAAWSFSRFLRTEGYGAGFSSIGPMSRHSPGSTWIAASAGRFTFALEALPAAPERQLKLEIRDYLIVLESPICVRHDLFFLMDATVHRIGVATVVARTDADAGKRFAVGVQQPALDCSPCSHLHEDRLLLVAF